MPSLVERFSLANQRALSTGASRGLGAEIAVALADAGADLVLFLASPAADFLCAQVILHDGGLSAV